MAFERLSELPDREIYTPPGGPPATDRIPPAVFEAMGEENIRAFARAFYARLAASSIAGMFPTDGAALAAAADRSADMLIFLFGGPPVYQRKHGPPRMRQRHLPFVITEAARAEWVRCFRETVAEAPSLFAMPAEHAGAVDAFFDAFSRWMVNAHDEDAGSR
jgi:hemoglobin